LWRAQSARTIVAVGQGADTVVAGPGWYPDPWSVSPSAQRWFDGSSWTSATRPAPTDDPVVLDAPDIPVSRRHRSHARRARQRSRLTWVLIAELVALTLIVAAVVAPRAFVAACETLTRWAAEYEPSVTDVAADSDPTTTIATPLGQPDSLPDERGSYRFLDTQPGDPAAPIAWDPCRPIRYVINPTDAPPGATDRVHAAVERASRASGLRFEFAGFSAEAPRRASREVFLPERYGADHWAPVLVAWSRESVIPELGGQVVGWGGPRGVLYDGMAVYVTGTVLLDADDLFTDSETERAETEATILHELGHVLGLDHVDDDHELMHDTSDGSVLDLGPGDRHGLAALGTQACHPGLTPGPTN